jgi:hypothetical protein
VRSSIRLRRRPSWATEAGHHSRAPFSLRRVGAISPDSSRAGCSATSAEPGERDRDVVGREREVRQDPEAAGAEVDALGGESCGDGFREEVRQPDGAVMIGEPGQAELDRKEE